MIIITNSYSLDFRGVGMNINLELYKTFYVVAKNGNITKASQELMVSQPAISKSIRNLEQQLRCCLFIRNKFGVVLTEEGKIFYEKIQLAMEIIENAQAQLLEMIHLDYGVLNIGISNTLTQCYLLPFIESFTSEFPNIKINIDTSPTYKLITKVRNGLIDFIILNLPYSIPTDFEIEKLRDIQDCFMASEKYLFLKGRVVPIEEMNRYPLILIAKGSNTRYFLDDFCARHHITLSPKMELASNSLVTSFIKRGLGIGIVTKDYLNDELKDGSLFEIHTIPKINKRGIGVIYLKNKNLSCCATKFLELLKREKNKNLE